MCSGSATYCGHCSDIPTSGVGYESKNRMRAQPNTPGTYVVSCRAPAVVTGRVFVGGIGGLVFRPAEDFIVVLPGLCFGTLVEGAGIQVVRSPKEDLWLIPGECDLLQLRSLFSNQ